MLASFSEFLWLCFGRSNVAFRLPHFKWKSSCWIRYTTEEPIFKVELNKKKIFNGRGDQKHARNYFLQWGNWFIDKRTSDTGILCHLIRTNRCIFIGLISETETKRMLMMPFNRSFVVKRYRTIHVAWRIHSNGGHGNEWTNERHSHTNIHIHKWNVRSFNAAAVEWSFLIQSR